MTRRKPSFLFVFAAVLFVFTICQAAENSDWPQYVRQSMCVPPHVLEVQHWMFKGTYQIRYTAKVCFPARDVIDGIAQAMAASHWDRLVYDPLNPGNKLSFALDRESKGGGAWWSTYPWKEFWKDKTGNVVYYRFAFDVDSPSPEAVHNSCSFKGVIIFYPKKTWELALKTLEDWRTKGAVNK